MSELTKFERSMVAIWVKNDSSMRLQGVKSYMFAMEDQDLTDTEEYKDVSFLENLLYEIKAMK